MHRNACVLLLVILTQVASHAAIRVELDGSGDYTDIQEAVDAAADGDTILIGPGRWDDMYLYTPPAGGWTDSVIVAINYKDLTLIGSGIGATIIGPTSPPSWGYSGPAGITTGTDNMLSVSNLSVVNMSVGIDAENTSFALSNVEVESCRIGTAVYSINMARIENSRFNMNEDIAILGGARASGIFVRVCEFNDTHDVHIDLQNIENVMIENSTFLGGAGSVQFDGASCQGVVQDCTFHSNVGPHISVVGHSQMTLNRCRLSGGRNLIAIRNGSRLTGEDNLLLGTDFEGGGSATVVVQIATLDLHNSHILRGDAPYSIRFFDYPAVPWYFQNLQNNYWGTTELDSIRAWITSNTDEPEFGTRLLLEPFFDQPIPNEPRSVSEIKRKFR